MSQEPPTVSEALSVVDRLAIRLLRIKAYGTLESARYDEAAASQWCKVLYDEERAEWRRVAREILADIACGDQGEMPATREYESRHEAYGAYGSFDDIGDAVTFADNVWPGSRVFERTRVSVRSEWTEVTA